MSILTKIARWLGGTKSASPYKERASRHDLLSHFDPAPYGDLLAGYRFCATMQLRTPLRVLGRHGEFHRGIDEPPPLIAREAWEGIWIPETKSWRELGIDARELAPTTMASDVGPIPADGGDYLKFLIAVRSIAEGDGSITARRARLSQELGAPRWSGFLRKLGGKKSISERLFPPFISTIPGMPRDAAAALRAKRLATPAKLAAAPDGTLLSIKGIGPAKVKAIRATCTAATDQNAEFVEAVAR